MSFLGPGVVFVVLPLAGVAAALRSASLLLDIFFASSSLRFLRVLDLDSSYSESEEEELDVHDSLLTQSLTCGSRSRCVDISGSSDVWLVCGFGLPSLLGGG